MEKTPALDHVLDGESACYAHLLCRECGAVLDEHHREPCSERVESVNIKAIGDDARCTESLFAASTREKSQATCAILRATKYPQFSDN
jgi:hypothetical protein